MNLTNQIYIQLLELYAHDLEVDNFALFLQVKAYEISKSIPQLPPTPVYPWNDPYKPPYKVTC